MACRANALAPGDKPSGRRSAAFSRHRYRVQCCVAEGERPGLSGGDAGFGLVGFRGAAGPGFGRSDFCPNAPDSRAAQVRPVRRDGDTTRSEGARHEC